MAEKGRKKKYRRCAALAAMPRLAPTIGTAHGVGQSLKKLRIWNKEGEPHLEREALEVKLKDAMKAWHKYKKTLELRNELYSNAQRCTAAYGGVPGRGGGKSFEDNMMRVIEQEQIINQRAAELREHLHEVRPLIALLPSGSIYSRVMHKRYLNGYSWEKVGKELNYDVVYMKNCRTKAVGMILEKLNTK